LCGYWNYSTGLPQKQDSQLTKREALDFIYSETSGGFIFSNGMTQDNEYMFASPYRDLYAGGLYDLRQDQATSDPFAVTAQFNDLKEVYYQATAPLATFLGTIWIDSSVAPNIVNYWDGTGWVPISYVVATDTQLGLLKTLVGAFELDANGVPSLISGGTF